MDDYCKKRSIPLQEKGEARNSEFCVTDFVDDALEERPKTHWIQNALLQKTSNISLTKDSIPFQMNINFQLHKRKSLKFKLKHFVFVSNLWPRTSIFQQFESIYCLFNILFSVIYGTFMLLHFNFFLSSLYICWISIGRQSII